jgi:hypothetical protein
MQKSSVSVDSDARSFFADNLPQPEDRSHGNQNGTVGMNDETAGKRHAKQRLDKQLLLKLFSETTILYKTKKATLPVDCDNELETPETPGKECPPKLE